MDESMEVAWWEWCRLCARARESNIDLTSNPKHADIVTAIGKYFWVNIRPGDLTQCVCKDCFTLINSLISFTERINKVQAMFLMLQNTQHLDAYEVCSQFNLLDENWEHIIKSDNIQVEDDNTYYENTFEDEEIKSNYSSRSLEANECVEEKHEEEAVEEEEMELDENEISEASKPFTNKNENNKSEENDESLHNDENKNVGSKDIENTQKTKINSNCSQKNNDNNDLSEDHTDLSSQQKIIDQSCSLSKISRNRNNSKYTCSVCAKSYKNPTSYRKHIGSHNLEPDLPIFKCEECEKVFPTENQLSQHKRVHLPLEEKLTVPCSSCDKKFVSEVVMKQHVLHVHENSMSYVCEQCGLRLKRLATFNEHKLTHSNVCAFECETCGKKFKNKNRLKIHSETHADTFYECSQCDLKLNSKRTLKMHMLVHSEKKDYKCNFCGAEFKRGKTLKNHLIAHIGLRPYSCNFCDKTFTNGSNCRAHKKKFHPIELAVEEAAGTKNEPTNVPNIDELRASESIQVPRLASRSSITPKMRALLVAAEQMDHNQSKEKSKTKDSPRQYKNQNENINNEFEEVVEVEVRDDSEYFASDIEENETLVFQVINENDL